MNSERTQSNVYQAWVDVGGTFTDCYVRSADGLVRMHKTLSSGRVPVKLLEDAAGDAYRASEICDDVRDFWAGADLVGLGREGQEVVRVPIQASLPSQAHGTLELSSKAEGAVNERLTTSNLTHAQLTWELDPLVEAPVLATRRILQIPLNQPLPALRVRLGTTKGTNALLTRRGAATAFATTAPFADLLLVGDQTRPDLFALTVDKEQPLSQLNLGIRQRMDASGHVVTELDLPEARQQLVGALSEGCRSLAICFMHSYVNPAHEQQLKQLAYELGFAHVSCSSELAPLIEIVARAQTTVVDAYLGPIIKDYLRVLIQQFGLHGGQLHSLEVMTSAGGLVEWTDYHGKDSILSGPAGGVAALEAIKTSANLGDVIGLDMGGTSTDVCRISDGNDLQYESLKAGVRILTPTLPIETVASGGGSVCWFDGVSLRVGPQSAGAMPGPACYGRGGPLTITDLNVFLNRVPLSQFPFQIDRDAINSRLQELIDAAGTKLSHLSHHELAEGFRRIANEQMAEAVRSVSISQGSDPRHHDLVGFGGAAGQHICEIAELLGMQRIIDTADAGTLSALGMGVAKRRLDSVVSVYRSLEDVDWREVEEQKQNAINALHRQHVRHLGELTAEASSATDDHLEDNVWHELRYVGTDATLTLAAGDTATIPSRFHDAHESRFGYARKATAIELVAVRISCTARSTYQLPAADRVDSSSKPSAVDAGPADSGLADSGLADSGLADSGLADSGLADSGLADLGRAGYRQLSRQSIQPGDAIRGPVIILNQGSTLVIESNWQAECLSDGTLLIQQDDLRSTSTNEATAHRTDEPLDLVFRDCLAARLAAIASQMGVVLQQTAVSVNVKQRRDYSCAVFDSAGRLLANAPHVPVHLGAMGLTVRAVCEQFSEISPGDSFITNDPYRGGSHLPDVTVITPVFESDNAQPVMFVANRAHHADIGGIAPGSMSVVGKTLGDEGVLIEPRKLTSAGQSHLDDLRKLFESARHPPRNVAENLADVVAQQAANARGVQLLSEYANQEGWTRIRNYSKHVLSAAESRIRDFVSQSELGNCTFSDHLDDGTVIQVAINPDATGTLRIDFTGSGPISPSNFNANPSIVSAAVIYVLRCLIADSLPLNEGILDAIELEIPPGILNPSTNVNAALSPAVAAGNVETSQRVVDVLLGAFGVAAASQGTMNNLLFGNETFGFYETICGGVGATADSPGADAVHSHMTNTRLTDPEILEARFPVRLAKFCIRQESGGAGRHRGGNGVVREIEFLTPVELSLITSRRGEYLPFGQQGGQPGKKGQNVLIGKAGRKLLPACCQLSIQAGERLEIQTPGGGGYGRSENLHNA